MTKSTFMLLAVETEGKIELKVKEITYRREDGSQSEVSFTLALLN